MTPERLDPPPIAVALLEELTSVWQQTEDAVSIRRSLAKIGILQRAVREIPDLGTLISDRVRTLYSEVFLRSVEDIA